MNSYQQILHLMQIHDSAFPIGAYTHSFGMETFIQSDQVRKKEELYQYCTSYLYHNLASGDAILVQEVYDATQEWLQQSDTTEKMNKIKYLDQICHGLKISSESRSASLKIGRQFMQAIQQMQHDVDEESFSIKDKLRETQKNMNKLIDEWGRASLRGHYAVMYGMYTSALNISREMAIMSFLHSSISSLVHNGIRAIPLGQKDGVNMIHRLSREIENVTKKVADSTIEDISNAAISIELGSMEHQYLYTRLFIS